MCAECMEDHSSVLLLLQYLGFGYVLQVYKYIVNYCLLIVGYTCNLPHVVTFLLQEETMIRLAFGSSHSS
jgi:hypothetical protein